MPAKPLHKSWEHVKGPLETEWDSSRAPVSVDEASLSIADESNMKITSSVAMVCC